jgi:hypothetical protein
MKRWNPLLIPSKHVRLQGNGRRPSPKGETEEEFGRIPASISAGTAEMAARRP